MNINLIEIGERISKRRKAVGLTQEVLAEKMDVSIQMISNLERGNKSIRIENLVNLCELLNVSTDYILLGRETAGCSIEDIAKLSERDRNLILQIIKYCSENSRHN